MSSSAWHSSSNTSEVDNLMSCVKIVRTLPTGSLRHSRYQAEKARQPLLNVPIASAARAPVPSSSREASPDLRISKLAKSQDIKSGKFLVGFSSSLSNRGKEDLHSFHSFSARGEARPTTNEGGKLALLAVALFLGLEHGSFIHLLMNSQLRQKQRRGGPRPGKGRVAEWSKAADCKSVEVFLRRFESCLSHLFVVDFREEKRGIRQRRKANRAKLLWPFREVQLYRMLVREVGELLRSIDSPSISNPNENRSE
ncbi:hypothetical protein Tco_1120172 [Tanacetum coccineum]